MSELVKGAGSLFIDRDGTFSWRKALTALVAFLFAVGVLGFLFIGSPELPMSYQVIISGVFTFYFFKDRLRGPSEPAK